MSAASMSRRVLITGASSEIGLKVCRRYLAEGHHVTAHFFDHAHGLRQLASEETNLELVWCDLSDLSSVFDFAQSHIGVDIVVFLAAQAIPQSLEGIDVTALESTLAVGALSNFIILGAIGPAMAKRYWGRFVIGSSIGVKFGGGSESFAYALTKHTSEFLPRSVRDWASRNVLTNIIRIGVTDTKLHAAFPGKNLRDRVSLIPMQRAASTQEIADSIWWFGSENNSYISGQTLEIAGGE